VNFTTYSKISDLDLQCSRHQAAPRSRICPTLARVGGERQRNEQPQPSHARLSRIVSRVTKMGRSNYSATREPTDRDHMLLIAGLTISALALLFSKKDRA
jgi:hypothetical protein